MAINRNFFLCCVLASTLTYVSSYSIISKTEDEDQLKNNELSGSIFIPKYLCPAIKGTFPHPTDCSKYYECRWGLAYEMTCSKKKYFDENMKVCRDKSKVKCTKDGGDKEPTEEPPKQKDFKCPYIWGTFPDPVDCSKYHICIYKIPTAFQCRSSELFDEKQKKCRSKNRVDCGKRLDRDQMTSVKPTTSTETETDPTITEEPFKQGKHKFFCPFRQGRYADPNDCAQYYECRIFLSFPHRCPKSKLYDERKEECVKAENVRCGSRPGGSNDGGKDPEPEVIKCPYTWGTFAHPSDCSKYVLCLYDVPTVLNCRKYELFNVFNRRCSRKEDVKCQKRKNPDEDLPITDTPIPPTSTQELTPSTLTTTEEPTTTTQSTTPETFTTPEPTITTEQTATATEPTTTTTETPTTTLSTTTVTEEATTMTNVPPPNDCDEDDVECIIEETGDISEWFNCPERYGQFPHLGSRQLFIYCNNWRPSLKRCATGTVFSLTYLVCSSPSWDE